MADETQPAVITQEIAASNDRLDITKPYYGPLEQNQDTVLAAKGGGLEVYEEVLRDDQEHSCFQQRRDAVIEKEWQVDDGGTDADSVAFATFIREMLAAQTLQFDDKCNKMLFGRFYGYATSEIMWAQDGRHLFIDQIKVRKARRFRFDRDGHLRLITRDNMVTGIEMPDRKFWTWSTGADNDDQPYGLGLGHWCYWPTFFKRNDMRLWLQFLDKFGQPTAVAKYPPNTEKADQQKALQAARAVGASTAVALPDRMVLELLEAARSGTADYATLHDKMNEAIAKVILSQTATTESTPGKLGGDEQKSDVRDFVAKSDSDQLCSSFVNGPVQWLRDYNYPNAKMPRVYRNFDQDEDLIARATRDKTIYDMGFEPSETYIIDTYGGDWTKREITQPNPFSYLAGPAQPDRLRLPAPPAQFAEADPIDKATTSAVDGWEEVMQPIGAAIGKTFAEATGFPDLRRQLGALRAKGLPTEQLGTDLTRVAFQSIGGGIVGDHVVKAPKRG